MRYWFLYQNLQIPFREPGGFFMSLRGKEKNSLAVCLAKPRFSRPFYLAKALDAEMPECIRLYKTILGFHWHYVGKPLAITRTLAHPPKEWRSTPMVMSRIFKILISTFTSLILCSHVIGVAGDVTIPKRVISLAPSYDETLIELGLKDKIVGVTTSSDYLEELKSVERVGLYMKPNIEKIVSLHPDLVFATSFIGEKSAVEKLTALGIKVIVIEMEKTDDIFTLIKQLGDIFGIKKRSEETLAKMNDMIGQTKRKTERLSRPRVYVETGYDPLFTCGKGSFIHDLIEIAGGINIAGEINQPFPRISSEFILSKDPEVIILPYMGRDFGKETLKKRSGWKNISAVKAGRIYDDLDSHVITIPTPRLILYGLPELLKRIHPEIIKESE